MGILDNLTASLGGKKTPPLVPEVMQMRSSGMPDPQIIQQLQSKGVAMPKIQDAMMQADIKSRVAGAGPRGPLGQGGSSGPGGMPMPPGGPLGPKGPSGAPGMPPMRPGGPPGLGPNGPSKPKGPMMIGAPPGPPGMGAPQPGSIPMRPGPLGPGGAPGSPGMRGPSGAPMPPGPPGGGIPSGQMPGPGGMPMPPGGLGPNGPSKPKGPMMIGAPPGPQRPAPAPGAPPQGGALKKEGGGKGTEELIESVVNERLKDISSKIDALETFRVDAKEDLNELKGTLAEIKDKYISLQEDSSIRLEEYSKELENVGAQIKAMQKVLQKVFPAIAENVHQLTGIVEDLKTVKKED